ARVGVLARALLVRGNVDVLEPGLALAHAREAVGQRDLAGPHRLDLGPGQDDAGLNRLVDEVVVEGAPVGRDDPVAGLGLRHRASWPAPGGCAGNRPRARAGGLRRPAGPRPTAARRSPASPRPWRPGAKRTTPWSRNWLPTATAPWSSPPGLLRRSTTSPTGWLSRTCLSCSAMSREAEPEKLGSCT